MPSTPKAQALKIARQRRRVAEEERTRHLLAKRYVTRYFARLGKAKLVSDITTHIGPKCDVPAVLRRAAEEAIHCAAFSPNNVEHRFGLYVAERILCIVDHLPQPEEPDDEPEHNDDAQPEVATPLAVC